MYCFKFHSVKQTAKTTHVKSLLNHVLFYFHSVKQTAKNICEKLVESSSFVFILLNKQLRQHM